MRRPTRLSLLLYMVPYAFLAMWIEWKNCPTGLLILEIPVAILPLACLAVLYGKSSTGKSMILGNLINLAVSGGFVAALTFCGTCRNKCGNPWAAYFKPFSALTAFLLLQCLLFLVQWLIYALAKRRVQ